MAEIFGVISASLTMAESAIILSRALFNVIETLKNARKEIRDIADQLSHFSGSLHSLADIMTSQEHLCKPALFKNTKMIIARYRLVEAELKLLLKTPRSLARLTWCIKKTQVKPLLKNIEAIKMSIILELHVVQLAKEEGYRPLPGNTLGQTSSRPNRFRRLVESVVQANRQLVESAQRDDKEKNSTSQRYDHVRAAIDVYKDGSFDTATWLYHLVFSPEILDLPIHEPQQITARYQAFVTDDNAENSTDPSGSSLEPGSEYSATDPLVTSDRAMIVWGQQTEPSRVADRLLTSWTTLTDEQVTLSSLHSNDGDWCNSFHEMIEGMKDDADMTFEKWQEEDSLDETEVTAYRKRHPRENRRRSTRDSNEEGIWDLIDDSPSGRKNRPHIQKSSRLNRRKTRFGTRRGASPQRPWSDLSDQTTSTTTRPTLCSDEPYNSATVTNPFDLKAANPFNVQYQPRTTEPYSGLQVLHNPYGIPPSHLNSLPPPVPTMDNIYQRSEPKTSGPSEKESKVTTQRGNDSVANEKKQDSLDNRIIQILTSQQERQIKSEFEQANKRAEAEFQQNLAQRTEQKAGIQRLEDLILQQSEEQIKSKEMWRKERMDLERDTKNQVEEAKDLTERLIKAARAKEETGQKALEFAKSEALRAANCEAAAKLSYERKKSEKKSKERLEQYEKLMERASKHHSEPQKSDERPLRRTRIADGTRTIEVTEYTGKSLDSDTKVPFSPFMFFQEELQKASLNERDGNIDWPPGQSRFCKLRSSAASPSISQILLSDTAQFKQKTIIFPAMIDERSPKVFELQSSLAKIGVGTKVGNPQLNGFGVGSQSSNLGSTVVRSSILWEAPSLSIGSELLATYRSCGWRPPYARISDTGHTYFLGEQAVHSYFFRPDYKPQFASCNTAFSESIIIDKALIHEGALDDSGLRFECTECGSYVLDGRLQYSDLENLIERSFSKRETGFRKVHRQLQWRDDQMAEDNTNESEIQSGTPRPSVCTMENRTSYATSVLTQDEEHGSAGSTTSAALNRNSAPLFLKQTIFDEDISQLEEDTVSQMSSTTSLSSNSNNPFRKRMEKEKLAMPGSEMKSPAVPVQNIWDDPLFASRR